MEVAKGQGSYKRGKDNTTQTQKKCKTRQENDKTTQGKTTQDKTRQTR
jgi:hypothetical protein